MCQYFKLFLDNIVLKKFYVNTSMPVFPAQPELLDIKRSTGVTIFNGVFYVTKGNQVLCV